MKEFSTGLLILLLILTLLSGCKAGPPAAQTGPVIVATIHPYALIAQELVDTLFTVQTLLPPTASPHTWSPNPQDIIALNRAELVIANGLGLEVNLAKTLKGLGNKVITASSFIDAKRLMGEADGRDNINPTVQSNRAADNPHIWTSPDFLEEIIYGLANELGRRYPQYKDFLDARADQMLTELKHVTTQIQTERTQYQDPGVVALHDAFVYFFRYFHIDYVGSVQPSPGKDPAPRQLQELADAVQARGIKAILIEPQQNPKPAQTIANELHLKLITYDDLGTTLPAGTIAEFLSQNWSKIRAGL